MLKTIIDTVIKILLVAVVICAIATLIAFPTMWLWNWLMPDIFGLKVINFWQALGLNLLASILFGVWRK